MKLKMLLSIIIYKEHNMSECLNCNLNKCSIICQRHIGHAIYETIRNVTTCESKIGQYTTTYGKIEPDYRVKEQRKIVGESICTVLGKSNLTIGLDKIFTCKEFNLYDALEDYCKYIEKDDANTDIIKQYFKDINSKKRLFIPFKENTVFSVDSEIDGVPFKNKKNELYSHDWYIDNEYEIHCKISITTHIKRLTFDIERYNKEFSISAIGIDTNLNNIDIIRFDKIGLIKPIELIINNVKYAVDNVYIYKYNANSCYIIGYWEGSEIRYINNNEIMPVNNDISRYLKVIAWHKRLIAPYYIMKPITFNVDKGIIE